MINITSIYIKENINKYLIKQKHKNKYLAEGNAYIW